MIVEVPDKITFSEFIRLRRDKQTDAWQNMSELEKAEIKSAWMKSSKLLNQCQDLILYDKRYSHSDRSTWPGNKPEQKKEQADENKQ
jgi:hypothetical protein